MPELLFHGAAGEVTGSMHIVRFRDQVIALDRGLFQDDGPATPTPIFNCWYAFSDNQGASFLNQQNLFGVPPSDAIDFAQPATGFLLRDYIGIAAGADRVLTSFMGRNALDANPNKSLIFSSQILRQ